MCACSTAVRPELSIDISKTSTRMVNGKGKWSIAGVLRTAILHLPLPFTMRVEVLEISIDSCGRTAVLQAHMRSAQQ